MQQRKSNWSFDEWNTVINEYALQGDSILNKLNNRTLMQLTDKANRIGIKAKQPMTTDEIYTIKNFQPVIGDAVCFLMPNRCPSEIRRQIECLKQEN